jgi:NADP-dependent 3-hydroxy acid dehydrogenase YdfG
MNKSLVIITGASSGIGAAAAQIFSQAGYPVGLIARNLEAMEKLNLPNALCQSVDVTDHDALREAIKRAENKWGPVDCLINNAGFAKGGDFLNVLHDVHGTTVKVNILGVINGCANLL